MVEGRQTDAHFVAAALPSRGQPRSLRKSAVVSRLLQQVVQSRGSTSLPLLGLLAASVACSPASYALQARSAEQALRAAEQTAAELTAPYELVSARLYLEKAREEAGQAHYAVARRLLASAEQNAVLARTLASGGVRSHGRGRAPTRSDAEPQASTSHAEPGQPARQASP